MQKVHKEQLNEEAAEDAQLQERIDGAITRAVSNDKAIRRVLARRRNR